MYRVTRARRSVGLRDRNTLEYAYDSYHTTGEYACSIPFSVYVHTLASTFYDVDAKSKQSEPLELMS